MSEPEPAYKPGDIVNDHVLMSDGRWVPTGVTSSAASTVETYGQRYRRRWLRTALVVGALFAVYTFFGVEASTAAERFGAVIGGFLVGGLLWGSVANLVVASFK